MVHILTRLCSKNNHYSYAVEQSSCWGCMVVFVSVVACLSMTCTLPVYPCSVHRLFIHDVYIACLSMQSVCCLFIHDVYIACLSMTCTLLVYPWRVHCLFIHDMYIACLSMTCTLLVYPCSVRCLLSSMTCLLPVYPCNVSCLLCTLSTYHVCISLFNHAMHKKSLLTVS